MVKAVFDTCILIDYLNGIEAAKQQLDKYPKKAISVITWMEVMVGTDEQNQEVIKDWLSLTFETIDLNKQISQAAVNIRKSMRIKLPDAIIFASAQHYGGFLITRNTKDFEDTEPGVHVPYKL